MRDHLESSKALDGLGGRVFYCLLERPIVKDFTDASRAFCASSFGASTTSGAYPAISARSHSSLKVGSQGNRQSRPSASYCSNAKPTRSWRGMFSDSFMSK